MDQFYRFITPFLLKISKISGLSPKFRLSGWALQKLQTAQSTQHLHFWWAQVELTWKTRFLRPSKTHKISRRKSIISVDLSSSSVWNSHNVPCLANGGESGNWEKRGNFELFRRNLGFKSGEIPCQGCGTAILLGIRSPTETNTT